MNVARPRLLVVSMALAVTVVAGVAIVSAQGDEPPLDAQLTPGVVPYPTTGLGNEDMRGNPLPVVEVSDRNGTTVSTASFAGQPLVINFWFSTCPPCARELPDFAEVHAEVGDQVRFIGINPEDSVQQMERFAADRGVDYELYVDDTREFTNAIGATGFPITLFVTSEGDIVSQTGPIDADELRAEIDQLLEGSA